MRQGETKHSYQKFYSDDKRCFATIDNFKTFGEEAIVADRTKIKAKLRDRGKRCLWVGYAKNRSSDTYRLYNPKTRSIILSRDVTFLNQEKQPKIRLQSRSRSKVLRKPSRLLRRKKIGLL